MTNVYLTKIADNEYFTDGFINLWIDEVKEVMIDGEKFINKKCHLTEFDLSKEFENKSNWHCFETSEFAIFGLTNIKVWSWKRYLSIKLLNIKGNIASQNEWVNLHFSICDLLNICCKVIKHESFDDFRYNLLAEQKITYPVMEYGYNNIFCFEIDYSKILTLQKNETIQELFNYLEKKSSELSNSRYSKYYKLADLFPDELFENKLNDIDKTNLVIKLFQMSIEYKNNKL